jgi:hypothetical protein
MEKVNVKFTIKPKKIVSFTTKSGNKVQFKAKDPKGESQVINFTASIGKTKKSKK